MVKIFQGNKKQKPIKAINGISFKLNSGEIFGFLGPNGAGKTTTVRCLAGLLKPTSGYARILNHDVEEMGDRIRKNIGFLTENHGNYENLTVYDNLRFFGSFYDIEDLELRINEVIEELGIKDRRNMKVGKLSKGLKQRVALARVLLHDPKILFLDEPTAGLDPQAAANVRELIAKFKTEDRLIFINSHNLDEVQKICDKVAIINNGRIMRFGNPSELSKEVFGSQELIVTGKNMLDKNNFNDIDKFQFIESFRVNENVITVHLNNLDKYTPELIEYFVTKGVKILEVKRSSHSLEEIYLTLINEAEEEEI